MIGFDETVRLVRLREQIIRATLHEMQKDHIHKSSEAAVSISFCIPSMFDDEQAPTWIVEAYSYVLGHGMESWHGRTSAEAIAKAEDAVAGWCQGAEMEMFARRMTGGAA